MKTRIAFGLLFATLTSAVQADWQYSSQQDKMNGGSVRIAAFESNNTLSLPFPYQGQNNGRIVIRQQPSKGLNVYVQVDKGQILCRSYSNCRISVKFDEGKPVSFRGIESGDNSTTLVFLEPEQRFVDAAKKAKTILVELTMYQAGNQLLEFHSSKALEWSQR